MVVTSCALPRSSCWNPWTAASHWTGDLRADICSRVASIDVYEQLPVAMPRYTVTGSQYTSCRRESFDRISSTCWPYKAYCDSLKRSETVLQTLSSFFNCFISHQLPSLFFLSTTVNQTSAMVTVAVAGGTGGIGRTIVEELVRQGKHQVVILIRSVCTHNPSDLTHH